ncbi:hypothetical protein CASFOL_012462 [Castilleja foliolosa]|uniref:Endonuclease/exonuclease/phosphatase domain-containing protein n=1 Tax=Castilleja foliolosa TaxID=1961234 RepID=A0ABD3DIY9_9LAMI
MKILSWNCRGLAKPAAIRALSFSLKKSKPDILFLCEVKILVSHPLLNALNLAKLSNHVFVPPIGNAGGLLLAWNNDTKLKVLVQNHSFIHSIISHDTIWYFTANYTPCYPNQKALFWSDIGQLSIPDSSGWLMMGDFNSILSQSEKKGGSPFACSSTHNLSNELNSLNLVDLGFSGHPFTWSNKRAGIDNIQQRLDRGVANTTWITNHPLSSILHLDAIASDHRPIYLDTNPIQKLPTPFRYENMWADDPTCFDTISKSWKTKVFGSPPFKLVSKIRNVKKDLKSWNLNHFGNVQAKIREINDHIAANQLKDITGSTLAIDEALQVELDSWIQRSETLWRQKAKDKWLKQGDANTRYFHQ